MKPLLLLSMLTVIALFANAQISGVVVTTEDAPIKGATVALLHAKDSSVAKLALTKDDGTFSFTSLKETKYIVSSTHVGYAKVYSSTMEVSDNRKNDEIKLVQRKVSASLADVNVVTKRPLIEVKPDKMVVNVEG